jgi:hypothetical protein
MKIIQGALFSILIVGLCGCGSKVQQVGNKLEKGSMPLFDQTPEDEAFAKSNGAVWITTNRLSTQLTVDFQDGLFSEGSILACDLWVGDIQRENSVLLLTGTSFSMPTGFEIETKITTNMLSSIRTTGGRLSFVRLAFQVESLKRIESNSEEGSDHYLLHGKALAVEPIQATEAERRKN